MYLSELSTWYDAVAIDVRANLEWSLQKNDEIFMVDSVGIYALRCSENASPGVLK